MMTKQELAVRKSTRNQHDTPERDRTEVNFAKQHRVIAAIDAHIRKRSKERGKRFTIQDMSEELGAGSYQMLVSLRTGTRYLGDMNQEFVRKLASTLGVSLVTLYQMAGFITPEDMYYDDDLPTRAGLAYEKMCKDPSCHDVVPTQEIWDSWPQSARNHFAIFYEHYVLHGMQLFKRLEEETGTSKTRKSRKS